MFRKALSFVGLLLLAGATVLVTPDLSMARGGGGHGGGGHGGGGFHGGGFNGGYGGGFRTSGYSGHPYAHYGNRFYGGYAGYPYSYNTDAYDWPNTTYDSGYYGSYGYGAPSYPDSYYSVTPPTTSAQSIYSPAPAESDTSAQLTVRVPANAEVWVDGAKTTSTGSVREYKSPPLAPGSYTYDLSARWTENGHEVTQKQTVHISPGARVSATFPIPPAQER